MSKSKGNVLDPLDIVDGIDLDSLLEKRTQGLMQPHLAARIEKATRKEFPDGIAPYGADALRMTLASLATTGRDVSLDLGRVEGYRNFCNKLWNAAHFVYSHTDCVKNGDPEFSVADRWIQSRLNETVGSLHESIGGYRLDLAAQALYEFTWHEFCDWYLELTKPILLDAGSDPALRHGTVKTLANVLSAILRLLHPIMPFVTEELWLELCSRTGTSSESIMCETLPELDDFASDKDAENEIEWIKAFIVGVRQIRGEMDISPAKKLPVSLAGSDPSDRERLDKHRTYLTALARLESIDLIDDPTAVSKAATALVGKMRMLVPLAGLIDLETEIARLTKQRTQIEADLGKTQAKLNNSQFVSNAPAEIVTKEKNRMTEFKQKLEQLNEQIEGLQTAD